MTSILSAILLYAIVVALIACSLSFVVSFLIFRRKKFSFRRMMIAGLSGECTGFLVLLIIMAMNRENLTLDVTNAIMGMPLYFMGAGVVAGIIWISRDRTGYWQ